MATFQHKARYERTEGWEEAWRAITAATATAADALDEELTGGPENPEECESCG